MTFEYYLASMWKEHNFTVVWTFLKSWEYQTSLTVSWETCMQVKKQQLEPDMKQQTGSSGERSTQKLCIVTLLT